MIIGLFIKLFFIFYYLNFMLGKTGAGEEVPAGPIHHNQLKITFRGRRGLVIFG